MIKINTIKYRGKTYYKANSVIKLLGYNGRINTATFVLTNVPEENRKQFSGREVWYVDEYGVALILLKGKKEISESIRKFSQTIVADLINKVFTESINNDGELEINPETSIHGIIQ